ncbi:hypothetical protein KBT16_24705 [Nostoc sp. CCCryo 231-06]|nr:hypothetical protein [Nostoc sp. CCCryo 231-06]
MAINPIDRTQVVYASSLAVHKIDSKDKPIPMSFPNQDERDNIFSFGLKNGNCTAFSPDGKLIAVSSFEDLHVWQATTGDRLYKLPSQLADDKRKLKEPYKYLAFAQVDSLFPQLVATRFGVG